MRIGTLFFVAGLTACGVDARQLPDPPIHAPITLDSCFSDLQPPSQAFVQVQTLKSPDGRFGIRLATQPGDRTSIGETWPYDLVRFAIRDGRVDCSTLGAELEYDFGHHNWDEQARATFGSRRYVVKMKWDGDWIDSLEVRDADSDALLEGPFGLEEDGCYSDPYDFNPCFNRTRTDSPGD